MYPVGLVLLDSTVSVDVPHTPDNTQLVDGNKTQSSRDLKIVVAHLSMLGSLGLQPTDTRHSRPTAFSVSSKYIQHKVNKDSK